MTIRGGSVSDAAAGAGTGGFEAGTGGGFDGSAGAGAEVFGGVAGAAGTGGFGDGAAVVDGLVGPAVDVGNPCATTEAPRCFSCFSRAMVGGSPSQKV
jgi:hypothetical protein